MKRNWLLIFYRPLSGPSIVTALTHYNKGDNDNPQLGEGTIRVQMLWGYTKLEADLVQKGADLALNTLKGRM